MVCMVRFAVATQGHGAEQGGEGCEAKKGREGRVMKLNPMRDVLVYLF